MADALRIVEEFYDEGDPAQTSPADWGVTRKQVVDQLENRVTGNEWPSQQFTSLCGPAAFMFCLLEDRPDIYARFVIDLWRNGRAYMGSLDVQPSYRLRANTKLAVETADIAEVDWMSLGGLRGFDGAYSEPKNSTAASTHTLTLSKWFNAVGAQAIHDNSRILGRGNWSDLLEVSCFIDTSWVVMLVNASILPKARVRGGSFIADHWIVATGAIFIDNKYAPSHMPAINNRACINASEDGPPNNSWPLRLTAFSWGERNNKLIDAPNTTVKYFLDHYHGAFVFSSIP